MVTAGRAIGRKKDYKDIDDILLPNITYKL